MEIKTMSDYTDELKQKFPEVSEQDIKRIMQYGLKSLYLHNSYGGDTFISGNGLWCYIGHLKKDSIEYFKYYIKKLILKLRVLYKRKKIKWDGYYYFALADYQYEEYIKSKNKRGRPKKYFTFKNVALYQIYDECKISEYNKKYLFRIPYISNIKMKFFLEELKTDKAEFILERSPLKFEDILVYENEYEFL